MSTIKYFPISYLWTDKTKILVLFSHKELALGKNTAPTIYPQAAHLVGVLAMKKQWKTFLEQGNKGVSSASGVPNIASGIVDVPVLVPVTVKDGFWNL